jgi:hypothetical protein
MLSTHGIIGAMLEFVLHRIGTRNLAQLKRLAGRSGVPYPTVLKVARGYTKRPMVHTVEALYSALKRERSRRRRRA